MPRKLGPALGVALIVTSAALADPIEGDWKTASGATAAIAGSGGGFAVTLKTGKHAGRRVGAFRPAGDASYAGTITDPESGRTYSGKAAIAGRSLTISGCLFGGLICKDRIWTRMPGQAGR